MNDAEQFFRNDLKTKIKEGKGKQGFLVDCKVSMIVFHINFGEGEGNEKKGFQPDHFYYLYGNGINSQLSISSYG